MSQKLSLPSIIGSPTLTNLTSLYHYMTSGVVSPQIMRKKTNKKKGNQGSGAEDDPALEHPVEAHAAETTQVQIPDPTQEVLILTDDLTQAQGPLTTPYLDKDGQTVYDFFQTDSEGQTLHKSKPLSVLGDARTKGDSITNLPSGDARKLRSAKTNLPTLETDTIMATDNGAKTTSHSISNLPSGDARITRSAKFNTAPLIATESSVPKAFDGHRTTEAVENTQSNLISNLPLGDARIIRGSTSTNLPSLTAGVSIPTDFDGNQSTDSKLDGTAKSIPSCTQLMQTTQGKQSHLRTPQRCWTRSQDNREDINRSSSGDTEDDAVDPAEQILTEMLAWLHCIRALPYTQAAAAELLDEIMCHPDELLHKPHATIANSSGGNDEVLLHVTTLFYQLLWAIRLTVNSPKDDEDVLPIGRPLTQLDFFAYRLEKGIDHLKSDNAYCMYFRVTDELMAAFEVDTADETLRPAVIAIHSVGTVVAAITLAAQTETSALHEYRARLDAARIYILSIYQDSLPLLRHLAPPLARSAFARAFLLELVCACTPYIKSTPGDLPYFGPWRNPTCLLLAAAMALDVAMSPKLSRHIDQESYTLLLTLATASRRGTTNMDHPSWWTPQASTLIELSQIIRDMLNDVTEVAPTILNDSARTALATRSLQVYALKFISMGCALHPDDVVRARSNAKTQLRLFSLAVDTWAKRRTELHRAHSMKSIPRIFWTGVDIEPYRVYLNACASVLVNIVVQHQLDPIPTKFLDSIDFIATAHSLTKPVHTESDNTTSLPMTTIAVPAENLSQKSPKNPSRHPSGRRQPRSCNNVTLHIKSTMSGKSRNVQSKTHRRDTKKAASVSIEPIRAAVPAVAFEDVAHVTDHVTSTLDEPSPTHAPHFNAHGTTGLRHAPRFEVVAHVTDHATATLDEPSPTHAPHFNAHVTTGLRRAPRLVARRKVTIPEIGPIHALQWQTHETATLREMSLQSAPFQDTHGTTVSLETGPEGDSVPGNNGPQNQIEPTGPQDPRPTIQQLPIEQHPKPMQTRNTIEAVPTIPIPLKPLPDPTNPIKSSKHPTLQADRSSGQKDDRTYANIPNVSAFLRRSPSPSQPMEQTQTEEEEWEEVVLEDPPETGKNRTVQFELLCSGEILKTQKKKKGSKAADDSAFSKQDKIRLGFSLEETRVWIASALGRITLESPESPNPALTMTLKQGAHEWCTIMTMAHHRLKGQRDQQKRAKGRATSSVPMRWLIQLDPCHPDTNAFFNHPPSDITDLRAYLDYTGKRATSPYDSISAARYSTITGRYSKQSLVWLGYHLLDMEQRQSTLATISSPSQEETDVRCVLRMFTTSAGYLLLMTLPILEESGITPVSNTNSSFLAVLLMSYKLVSRHLFRQWERELEWDQKLKTIFPPPDALLYESLEQTEWVRHLILLLGDVISHKNKLPTSQRLFQFFEPNDDSGEANRVFPVAWYYTAYLTSLVAGHHIFEEIATAWDPVDDPQATLATVERVCTTISPLLREFSSWEEGVRGAKALRYTYSMNITFPFFALEEYLCGQMATVQKIREVSFSWARTSDKLAAAKNIPFAGPDHEFLIHNKDYQLPDGGPSPDYVGVLQHPIYADLNADRPVHTHIFSDVGKAIPADKTTAPQAKRQTHNTTDYVPLTGAKTAPIATLLRPSLGPPGPTSAPSLIPPKANALKSVNSSRVEAGPASQVKAVRAKAADQATVESEPTANAGARASAEETARRLVEAKTMEVAMAKASESLSAVITNEHRNTDSKLDALTTSSNALILSLDRIAEAMLKSSKISGTTYGLCPLKTELAIANLTTSLTTQLDAVREQSAIAVETITAKINSVQEQSDEAVVNIADQLNGAKSRSLTATAELKETMAHLVTVSTIRPQKNDIIVSQDTRPKQSLDSEVAPKARPVDTDHVLATDLPSPIDLDGRPIVPDDIVPPPSPTNTRRYPI
eukprot:gene6855-13885_t